jgi:tetratricopeptide (TPR) repeat protein
MEAPQLCALALNNTRQDWEAGFADDVSEAKRRNLSIDDCRVALALPRLSSAPQASLPLPDQLREDFLQAEYDKPVTASDCAAAAGSKIDIRIRACTDIIESEQPSSADRAYARYSRGVAYAEKGDYDQAIADYDRAIQLKPDFGLAYYGRGNSYKSKGDAANALDDFRAAARLIPEGDQFHGEALARIAEIDRQIGAQPTPPPPASTPTVVETPEPTPRPPASKPTAVEIHERAAESVDLVDDDHVDPTHLDVGQEAPEGRAPQGAAREALPGGGSAMTTKADILHSIRQKCLDCSCFQPSEIRNCPVTTCGLWPYRFGTDPDPSTTRGFARSAVLTGGLDEGVDTLPAGI